jgi:hypothetical protein
MLRGMKLLRRIPPPSPLAVAGCLLAAGMAYGAWRGIDAYLASEATRLAAEGDSLTVVATRSDWVRHVVPAALGSPGKAGDEARTVVNAHVDLATRRAASGEPAPLARLAASILEVLRGVEVSPTREGARWGAWMAKRLVGAAEHLSPTSRASLLTSADRALEALARTPRSRVLPAPTPIEAVAASPPAQEPQPEPINNLPPVAARLATASKPTAEAPTVSVPPPLAEGWRPPERATPAEPTAVASAPVAIEPEPIGVSDLSDLGLLAEALRLRPLVAPSDAKPQALGPTRVPAPGEPASFDADRARFDEVRIELRRRGYAAVTDSQARGLVSESAEERLALVQRSLQDPSGDPARVLLTLSRDSAPEVRAAAISALGSSTSRALVEAALAAAVADSDPRVGKLAETLRNRLR